MKAPIGGPCVRGPGVNFRSNGGSCTKSWRRSALGRESPGITAWGASIRKLRREPVAMGQGARTTAPVSFREEVTGAPKPQKGCAGPNQTIYPTIVAS